MPTKAPTSTMTTSTVSLKFDCVGAEQPSLTPLQYLQMLAFEYPIRPFTFGPRSSPFSLCHIWQLAAWALGVCWGSGPLGAATRCPRRRRPFHFFSRLGLVLDTDSGFAGHDDGRRTTDDGRRNRAHPRPPFQEQKIAKNFIANFFWRF